MKKEVTYTGLLILLITILFQFELNAQENTGDCRVLLSSISEKYDGECVDGFAEGKGIAEGINKYEGEFKKGLPHGKGKYTWANGNTYDGKWKKGKKEGLGLFYSASNNEELYGFWKDDEFIREYVIAEINIDYKTKNISKVTIDSKVSKENHIELVIMKDGMEYEDYTDFALYGSSGILRQGYSYNGLDYVTYPFKGTLRFDAPNYYRTGTNEYILKFEIEDRGSYLVKVYL